MLKPTTLVVAFVLFAAMGPDGQRANTLKWTKGDTEPKLTSREAIKLIGIEVRTTNRQETDPLTAEIPGLWGRFYQEQIADKIPNRKTEGPTIAAYSKYESDVNGAYSLIVGCEVTSLSAVPNGMTGVTIPAGKYLLFTASGPMPKTLIDTWGHIWNYFAQTSPYKRAYTVDYEVHSANDRADIYIAVK